jgi:hypothetical protein
MSVRIGSLNLSDSHCLTRMAGGIAATVPRSPCSKDDYVWRPENGGVLARSRKRTYARWVARFLAVPLSRRDD